MEHLFSDYTLRMVALGSAVLGVVSGGLGTYAVLRGQSLLGDAISHAALPGVALAFLLTGSKTPLALMIGAALAGWLATLWILSVTETTRIKYDSMLALTLSVFFGVGLVLLTWIRQRAGASQAGLDTFLFGQASSLVWRDVVAMAIPGGGALLLMLLFWKELKLLAFDPEYGRTLGLPMRRVDLLLTALLVVAIVIGLQTVGVVLMSAMIVAPAAAGRQWTDVLWKMVLLSAGFGAAGGVTGAVLSSLETGLPTGPLIVLCMGAIVAASLFFAPNRGLLGQRLRRRRNAGRFQRETVLLDLYALGMQHADPLRPHPQGAVQAMRAKDIPVDRLLMRLNKEGLVRRAAGGWGLTDAGLRHAETLRKERR